MANRLAQVLDKSKILGFVKFRVGGLGGHAMSGNAFQSCVVTSKKRERVLALIFSTILFTKSVFRRSIKLLGLSAVIAAISPAHADRALLLGVGHVPGLDNPFLAGPDHDVVLMEDFLVAEMGFSPSDIKTLVDGEVTRDAAIQAIEDWLIEGTAPGDRVVFYWSGHGSQRQDLSGDEADGLDETLVTHDFAQGKHIADDDLYQLFNRIADRQVTVVVDACHSGTIGRDGLGMGDGAPVARKAPVAAVEPFFPDGAPDFPRNESPLDDLERGSRSMVIWSAASAHQLAFTDTSIQPPRGLFTQALVDGMVRARADYDRNALVTNSELLAFVRGRSDAFCNTWRRACLRGLTPELELQGTLSTSPAFSAAADPGPSQINTSQIGAQDPPSSDPNDTPGVDIDVDEETGEVISEESEDAPGPIPSQSEESADNDVSTTAINGSAGPEPSLSSGLVLADPDASMISLSLSENRVPIGEAFNLEIEAKRDGQILIVAVDAHDSTRVLFPNPYSRLMGEDAEIEAGTRLILPPMGSYRFEATEPAGSTEIVALLIEDPINLDGLISESDWVSVADRSVFLESLNESLQGVVATIGYEPGARSSQLPSILGVRAVDWSMDRVWLEVIDPAVSGEEP